MAPCYNNVPHNLVVDFGLIERPDGTHFKTFTAPTLKELHGQMDEMRDIIHEAGGEEIHRTKIGRNATCFCGSGKKFKKCCLVKPCETGSVR